MKSHHPERYRNRVTTEIRTVIVRLYQSKMSQREIARVVGVSSASVNNVVLDAGLREKRDDAIRPLAKCPAGCKPREDARVEPPRALECPLYGRCLEYAWGQGWDGWTCAECPRYSPKEMRLSAEQCTARHPPGWVGE